jgi:nitroimidazol reductase NimA-like FMN-containing flavoprotein (pyridoxamine 5'-phosphate oxidase superfamily)
VFDSTGLEVLDPEECRSLLTLTRVGRIVFTHRALPAVQPVNFVLEREAIVIRTSNGSKLAAAARNAVVAFQIDEIDPDGHGGWSVTVIGHAEEVRDSDERSRLALLPLHPWAPGDKDHFIRIPLELVEGRRIPQSAARASATP